MIYKLALSCYEGLSAPLYSVCSPYSDRPVNLALIQTQPPKRNYIVGEWSLSDIREFLVTNLGEVEDKQFQLFEPVRPWIIPHEEKRRVLKLPVTRLRFVKNSLQKAKRLFADNKRYTVELHFYDGCGRKSA